MISAKFYSKLRFCNQANYLLKSYSYASFSTSILNRKEFSLKLDNILDKMSEVVLKNDEKNSGK
jgi:hypothetical protein